MKAILILSLVTALFALNPCKKFVCRDHADPQNLDVCAILEKKGPSNWIQYVGNCPRDKTCYLFPGDQNAVKCMVIPDTHHYPGSRARNASLCHGKIEGGYCRGKKVKEPCEHHVDCDVGLRCGMYKECEEASLEGEWCDGKENLCKSYLLCKEGRCVKYGSVPNNENPGKQDPDLCKSHHIYKGVCAEAPKLDGKIFVDKVEDICDYSNGEKSPAECGFHQNAKAICKPGDADLATEWHELLDYLSAKPVCNSYLGHLSICDYGEHQVGRKYIKAGIDYYLLHQYVVIQENAQCVKRYNFPEYFDLVRRYNGAATVSTLLGLAITMLLLLI